MIYLYTSMRPLAGLSYSSSEQNNFLRGYCLQKNMSFSIPHPEFVYPSCFVQLFNLTESADPGSVLIFFSREQLRDYREDIEGLYSHLSKKFITLIFAFEDIELSLVPYQCQNQNDDPSLSTKQLLPLLLHTYLERELTHLASTLDSRLGVTFL